MILIRLPGAQCPVPSGQCPVPCVPCVPCVPSALCPVPCVPCVLSALCPEPCAQCRVRLLLALLALLALAALVAGRVDTRSTLRRWPRGPCWCRDIGERAAQTGRACSASAGDSAGGVGLGCCEVVV